ncbi:MAG: ribosome maturation factor RimP [Acidobacteria bacterium]|nr:ribosome maturation factor RimP [Acidobacteriota bacterium]MBI3422339.1 ribosome maturation factor RimP [Acidobacteriota bacterium]
MKLDPRVQELVERLVVRQGLELVHVEWADGRQKTLCVYIDKPGGVTVDDCAEVSRQLSVHLDVEDFIPTHYLLEVASPGLDRGLYKAADYERFAGLPAHVKLSEPLNGQRNFHGKLLGLDKEGELQTDWAALLEDETGKQQRLPLAKILKANVEIEP